MNLFFRSSVTHFPLWSLLMTFPSYAMDTGIVSRSVQRLPSMSVDAEEKSEDWKSRFYKQSYPFPIRLNMPVLSRSIVANELQGDQIHSLLREASLQGDSLAQERLYTFLTKEMFGLNIVNHEEAKKLLLRGLEEEQAWAFWEKAKMQEGISRWHCMAADLGHKKADEYVRERINPAEVAKDFLNAVMNERKVKKKYRTIMEFKKQWWEKLCYGQPFWEVLKCLEVTPVKELDPQIALFQVYAAECCSVDYFRGMPLDDNSRYDSEAQLRIFLSLARKGNEGAMQRARILLGGGFEGKTADKKRALQIYLEAAAQGSAEAQLSAAELLFDGFEGQPADKKRALQLCLEAAAQGSAEAQISAAHLLFEGFEGQPANMKRALELYLAAAEQGYMSAQYNVATLLHQGFEGQPADKMAALQLYLKAAAQGHMLAQFRSANLLQDGFEGQPVDTKRALQLFLKAAAQGLPEAQQNAAILLSEGFEGQSADKKRALELFLKAAAQGLPEAHHSAAILLSEGFEGQPVDKKRALQLFLKAASQGLSEAQFSAALLLEDGFRGQPADKKRALKLYLKAAEQAHTYAQFNAGLLLQKGFEGQPSDKKQAFELYSAAIAHGHQNSLNNLAVLLRDGFEGQPADNKAALELFLKRGEQGCMSAQFNAALLLHQGFEEQPANKKRALELYLAAAAQGHSYAQYNAAFLLKEGFEGQPADKKAALQLYLKAAAQGLCEAQYNAALLLEKGFEGQPSNKKQAFELYLAAAEQGVTESMIGVARLYLDSSDRSSHEGALFWLEKARALGDEHAFQLIERAKAYFEDATLLENEDAVLDAVLKATEAPRRDMNSFEIVERGESNSPLESVPYEAPDQPGPSFSEEGIQGEESTLSTDSEEVESDHSPVSQEYIRDQLVEVYKMKEERVKWELSVKDQKSLSHKNQEIVEIILKYSKGVDTVSIGDVFSLFSDPFFAGQVRVYQTKSGFMVTAHNSAENTHATVSSHRQHGKRQKALPPAFVSDLRVILELFGIRASG